MRNECCRVLKREQWVEYVCETLPRERAAIVARHIAACSECRQRSEELLSADRRLIAAAASLRESLPAVNPTALAAFDEWRQNASVPGFVPQRLLRLELFLTPICGFRTAERAMRVAARQALVDSVDLLTECHWPVFVKNLSSLVGALCGEFTGELLWRVGQTAA
jgi:anti-sigma factor RsiW